MDSSSLYRLFALSAIWGASFLFVKIGAPVLGPVLLIFCRVLLAATFLLIVAVVMKREMTLLRHWKHFLMFGFFGTALPFMLFAYAASTISASLLSILNATSPIWAAGLSAAWTRKPLSPKSLLGLGLGLGGVALLAGVESMHLPSGGVLAIFSGLAAAFSYGLATVYANHAEAVDPFSNAVGSVLGALLIMTPLLLIADGPSTVPAPHVLFAVFALGVVCSGVAFLLYFRLVADVGPAPALTVTFLIPVFGILWGVIFLGESVGWHTLLGSVIVLAGTALVTGFSFKALALRFGQ